MMPASNLAGFREAILVALKAGGAHGSARPFGAFRGDFRRPMKRGGKVRKGEFPTLSADYRRLVAMNLAPDRASNIAKLQRGLRIIARIKAAANDKV